MKLLILCQKINKNDPILGFFDRWVEVFSQKYEKTTVICLEKGESELPPSIPVLSLGKEKGNSRFQYLKNFFRYIWNERNNYDAVFVHMNQEYVILGWSLWKLLGKKVYLWRNHHYGNAITWTACVLSDKIFCTSSFSYTNKFKKCVIMPTGIDLERFSPRPVPRVPNSVLFIARISPVKKQDMIIRALAEIEVVPWVLTILGATLPADILYRDSLITLVF